MIVIALAIVMSGNMSGCTDSSITNDLEKSINEQEKLVYVAEKLIVSKVLNDKGEFVSIAAAKERLRLDKEKLNAHTDRVSATTKINTVTMLNATQRCYCFEFDDTTQRCYCFEFDK
jgi:transcription elongation factor